MCSVEPLEQPPQILSTPSMWATYTYFQKKQNNPFYQFLLISYTWTEYKSTRPEDSDQWFLLTEHINLKFNRKKHNRNIFLFKCLVDKGKTEKLMDIYAKNKVCNWKSFKKPNWTKNNLIKDVCVKSTVELLRTSPSDVLQHFAVGCYFNCSRIKLTYISPSLYMWTVILVHGNLLQNEERKLFITLKRWPWVFQEIAHNWIFQQTKVFINNHSK